MPDATDIWAIIGLILLFAAALGIGVMSGRSLPSDGGSSSEADEPLGGSSHSEAGEPQETTETDEPLGGSSCSETDEPLESLGELLEQAWSKALALKIESQSELVEGDPLIEDVDRLRRNIEIIQRDFYRLKAALRPLDEKLTLVEEGSEDGE